MSYDKKFREQVLKIRSKEKLSLWKVALRFGIGKQTVYNWTKRIEAKKNRIKACQKIDMEALKQDIQMYPDAYQSERAQRFGVTQMGIWHALKRLNVSSKKTLSHPKVDPERRSAFCHQVREFEELGRPFVFLDESGFSHDMPRTHGYAVRGKRCFGVHNWGAKGRTNVIGALHGTILLTISLFETTINTGIFDAWVIQDLIPKLPLESGVIMDNAAFHKGQSMRKALQDAGHTLLYLPPYSPDLNPIEKKWAQAKAWRRKNKSDIKSIFQFGIL